ncbi:ATP-binding cassette domain-containing protein [Aliiglaciecola sp. LCG003]|uniref:ATP-binding cassette domain-containing protein n=1 Tax=Aliiglaciecola sp. LCG003 TaxID=3053655 RepID=UPI002573FAA6|nr:ATP-binding cassette domain-containing protein [Aliiglaciecola sp. LCG003]WJG09318.1 ATP-binding cassette domain-containing protein [Aliiglaciecola sp. LCG003]
MIQISDLTLLRGSKILLEQATATIFPGHKVGLIGSNGCGKSSLFALLRQELHPDAGECQIPKNWQIVSVAQETPASDRSALDYVIDGDIAYRQLQQKLLVAEQQHNGEQIALLHSQLEHAGAYDMESRAATILAGLGFSHEKMQHPVTDFSGGWRMRLNLAQALLCHSDLLLLDEPTNHLDLDAVIWLERWLARYTGTLMLISHDKSFLDNTVDEIVSVEQQKLISYTGNYAAYERQRAERLRLQDLEYHKQQAKVAHLESFINRFKAKASKAKQAQSRIKQLEKMEDLLPAHAESQFSFGFFTPPKLPNPLVKMEHVRVGYDGTVIIDSLHLNLVPGSRIGLLGRNGAGKSTLIKLLANEKQPMSGEYMTSAGLRIGYFAQHQLEFLRPQDSAIDHLYRLDKKATEQTLRDYLGGFGFNGDQALGKVAPMSGGEKARLVLALLVYQKPNLLLLDEPTNHLDLEMRHALNLALQSFEGAMVLVSHDRFLLTSVCDDFYLVDDGKVEPFQGDLDDYKDWLLKDSSKRAQGKDSLDGAASENGTVKLDRKNVKRLEAEFRQATQPLRKAIQSAEKRMEQLSQKLALVEQQLAEPDLYSDDNKAKLKTCLLQQAELKGALADAELLWLDSQEQLEVKQQEFSQQHVAS